MSEPTIQPFPPPADPGEVVNLPPFTVEERPLPWLQRIFGERVGASLSAGLARLRALATVENLNRALAVALVVVAAVWVFRSRPGR